MTWNSVHHVLRFRLVLVRLTAVTVAVALAVSGLIARNAALSQARSSSTASDPNSCGGPQSATRLFVVVTNIASAEGLIAITLYPDDRSRFLARRGSLHVVRVPAQSPTLRACVHLPTPGSYAVAVYHDTNGNRRFDRTGIGLPAEDYGFSNDPAVLLGLPSFRSTRFTITGDGQEISVRLRES
jgi:uncharacterized protein (DUF2141 family)